MRSRAFAFLLTAAFCCVRQGIASQAPPQRTPARISVEWKIQSNLRVAASPPVYPPLAQVAQIEGIVLLDLVIGTDGAVREVRAVSGHVLLQQAAIDSAWTWRFKPTLLNGVPAEVSTLAPVPFFPPGHNVNTYLADARKKAEKHPDDAKAHEDYGLRLINVAALTEGVAELQKAIELQPKNADLHIDLGKALKWAGDATGAISEYRLGISLDPKFARAHYELGLLLEKLGDLDGALEQYRTTMQMESGFRKNAYHQNIASVLMKKGDLDGAIAEYLEALRGTTVAPYTHFSLGWALEQKGDLAEALKEYKKAVEQSQGQRIYTEARDRVAAKLEKQ